MRHNQRTRIPLDPADATHSIVITQALDGTYTVHATLYATGRCVKSTLWPTLAEAEAEAKRIEASWRFGVLPTVAERGMA